MKRVPTPRFLKPLVFLICLLASAQSAFATTVVMPPDDQIIIEARAIITGRVLAVESGLDDTDNRIYTYVTIKVQEVLKGQVDRRKIVLKQPGGVYGSRGTLVFGAPQFTPGENVLLYLDTWRDGSLRVHQMLLGKFAIVRDQATGKLFADRNSSIPGVQVIGQSSGGPITNRMELSAYKEMLRSRLESNRAASQNFEATVYSSVPVFTRPPAYTSSIQKGDLEPEFHLWNPPIRWFEADTGQFVVFKTNLDSAPSAQAETDVAAATVAWSTVSGCSLRVSDGGTTNGCGLFGLDGENTVSFNNCDGYFSGTGTCSAGILAVTSIASYDRFQTIVINGVSFCRALESNLTFNPHASCYFTDHCNLREIITHEMGHALGLHHSWDSSFPGTPSASDQAATMYWVAHFDGRCASLKQDDINGITFIYPGVGGGPGPLSIVTSSLPTGTTGTAYNQALSASGGTLPYNWSVVAGQGTLPTGLNLSTGGVISGTPSATGTFNFTVNVTDSASPAASVQKALSIIVSATSALPLDSQFVSQSVPTSLQPGQSFNVDLKFLNTGTLSWSGSSNFYLVTQNPAFNTTWGGSSGANAVSLGSNVISSGQQLDAAFTLTAPSTTGTFNFQWQMYLNDGTGFFGQMSTNVAIQVGSAPPPPSRPDTIGLYSSGSAEFDLRNSNTAGSPDLLFIYGPTALGWVPLAGDWNGDGVTTVGLYNPATATFFLKNSNASGPADMVFVYGPAGLGWIPLVGDWNGDGVDTVGLYNPATSMFFLKNSNAAGPADLVFTYGPLGAGWIPLVGDWNGDGADTIGLYNPATSTFFLKNSNTAGPGDLVFVYGPGGVGWQPVVGDWNSDGTDTVGLYDPATSTFFLKNSNAAGPGDLVFIYQPSGNIPVIGKWH